MIILAKGLERKQYCFLEHEKEKNTYQKLNFKEKRVISLV